MSSLSNFFQGKPGGFEQQSMLGPQQQPILQNLTNAVQNRGAGGSFGDVADYYRNLISGGGNDFQNLATPYIRQLRQETLPGIANTFAGIGMGATNSTGYRNAVQQANTDLSERLASLQASLRQQGAEGLTGLGNQSLGNYFANFYRPRSPGFLESAAPGIGQAGTQLLGQYFQNQGKGDAGSEAPTFGSSLGKAGAGALGGFAAGGPWGAAAGGLAAFLPYLLSLFNKPNTETGVQG
jgi:hypothetical protein